MMMMEGGCLGKKKKEDAHKSQDHDIAEFIFSWSLDDILNQDLYKDQVEEIPLSFQSVEHYFGSFVYPLLEETRAELASSMEIMHRSPFAEICSFTEAKGNGKRVYDVTVGNWRNSFTERGKEPYKTLPGDLFILTDVRPESVCDLQCVGRTWAFALVRNIVDDGNDDGSMLNHFKVKASQNIEYQKGMFVVFLTNITTHKRIWSSLHKHGNMNIVKEVIVDNSAVTENCRICSTTRSDPFSRRFAHEHLLKLNESQTAAIMASVNKAGCSHKYSVEQIWGPPGTGKTTTVSVMLFLLLQMNNRILACAPTNVAIVQLASRVVNMVRESFQTRTTSGDSFCPVGDVLMFGNMERSKVDTGIEDICLENRIRKLTECLGSFTGWKHCMRSMIDLLEDCVSQYHVYLENKLFQEEQATSEKKKKKNNMVKVKSFIEFLRDRFKSTAPPLIRCIITLCSHIPMSFIREDNFQSMVSLLNNLGSFESLLFQENLVSEELQKAFASKPQQDDDAQFGGMSSISRLRLMSCSLLKDLQVSLERLGLPGVLNSSAIKDFCFERASLIFCTASTSYKLCTTKMEPLNLLVIDEAAQLKEAESTIPLQLPGIKHVILIGDECQLPAMVKSNVSRGSCFGRSLFERLTSLGYSKHLLDVQYRMQPSISFFPNWKCYQSGKEEKDDDGQSLRNMVEVALVIKIVQNLYRACHDSIEKLSIGVVSPYAAQVANIPNSQIRQQTMCFERAGKTVWKKLAKASGLRASADQMRITNPEAYQGYLRKAAGMFECIEKFESAASCYCDLGEYERAGKIYLYKCGKIDAAAECFTLAGCYSDAAEAYAKGDQFSNCLSACKKGKLFDKGMQYIEYWKKHVDAKSKELEQIEQEFLENCAFECHKQKDPKSMMKLVRAFRSMESKRVFLRSLGCLDDLLLLEEESGLFLDVVELARSRADVIKEADLLEKAGQFKEATVLLLWYVFFGSLWGNGNRGWPLKQFSQKEELCRKTKSLAKMDSDLFYDFACNEIELLSDQQSNLTEVYKHLHNSQMNNSLRGEILAIRKIVDSHLHLNPSSFDWEAELPTDINKYCDDMISENRVSLRTLVYYWNMWKQNVVDIFQSLRSLEYEKSNKHKDQIEFILNYFGVRKQCVEGKMVYLLVEKDADWIRNNGEKGLHSDGKHLTIDIKQLVSVVRSYWQSELVSVGIKVLEIFVRLHKSRSSAFHQSTSLLHMFEVSKFLLSCQHLSLTSLCKKKLHIFLGISATYFDLVFPLDWRNAVSEDLISLRETDLSINLLADIILQSFDTKGDITYWTIGRVMMIYLTYGKRLGIDHMLVKGLKLFPSWKSFVVKYSSGGLKHANVALELHYALKDTFIKSDIMRPGYISIQTILYFLDSFIFFGFISSGIFFTTRSFLVGWLTEFPSTATPSTHLSAPNPIHEDIVHFIFELIQEILQEENSTASWIRKSKINPTDYHPLLALKLAMIISLFVLQAAQSSNNFMQLISPIAHLLPPKFVSCLLKPKLTPALVAEAFLSIADPLIVSSRYNNHRIDAPCAIFVDLRKSKEEILSVLFAKKSMPCCQFLENFGVKLTYKSGMIPDRLLSLASNTTEVHQVKNHKEIGDEPSTVDGNTQDVKNKKVKGKRNRKKDKRYTDSGQTSSNNVDVETVTLEASEWDPQFLENIAKFINDNKGESLSSSSVIALIKRHFIMKLQKLAIMTDHLKSPKGEDTEAREYLIKVWEAVYSEVKSSVTEKNMQAVLKKLQEDGMLDPFPTTQESNGDQMAVSWSRSIMEDKEETETDEGRFDGSAVEVVIENQTVVVTLKMQ